MKMWSPAEEAKRLTARFTGVNRAEFARTHSVPGGAAMIYQHLQGMRPINMEQAIAYARGFGVPLAEISPRWAKVAMDALGLPSDPGLALARESEPQYQADPKFALLHDLPATCQDAILTLANELLARAKARAASKAPATHH